MKIKFIALAIAFCLIIQPAAFAQNSSNSSEVAVKTAGKKTADKSTKTSISKAEQDPEYYNSTKSLADVKTFDFERIFREADTYFNAAQKWRALKCLPKTSFICSKRECPQLKLSETSALVLDKDKNTLAICHNKVCQYYSAEFEQTGVFTNVKVKNVNGIIIRVLGDSRFKEVAIVGLDAYITNGECVPLL